MAQRAATAAVLVAVFGGILIVSLMAGQVRYVVLYHGMEPADAGEVTSKLAEEKVAYRLAEGGTTIEVPAEKADELKVKLAKQNLPRSGSIGFEIFDKVNFGATDFTQQVNYQRALQGELSKTIETLDGVAAARVHLAIPEKRLFSEKDEPTTASVQLQVRRRRELSEEQVAGVVHLVSSAVKGLKPEHVTVLDGEGNLLSDRNDDHSRTGDQADYQERYERRLETELTQLAEQVLGPDKAAVRVSAEFDWDQTETTSETFKPGGQNGQNLPVQQSTEVERYNRNADGTAALPGTPAGVPGTSTNLTPGAAPTEPATTTDPGRLYDKSNTDVHYAVNKVVERKVVAPGKLRRVTVAVLLDQAAGGQGQALQNAFAAAAGLDLRTPAQGGRGDRIELLATQFDRTTETEAAKAAQAEAKQEQTNTLVRSGAAVAVVALVLVASFFVLKMLRPAQPKPTRTPRGKSGKTEDAVPQLDVVLADEPGLGGDPLSQLGYAAPEAQAEAPELVPARSTVRDRVRKLAEERPEDVARQLQIWMTE